MPPIKGKMFCYSEADMEAAIEECRRGVPTATAAKKFGVPRVTLLNKIKGKTPIKRKMGRNCYMTEEIEKMLVTWAKAMVKQGFPIGKDNLQDSVKKIVDDLNLETPFKNGRPGKRWYSSFLKRHPDLITRHPQNLTTSRASVTTSQLKNWFEEVNIYLNDNNYRDILNEPQRIFNMDETAFFLNPKGNKVLAPKGEKSVYQQINADEKECFTVLLGGNATGDVLPPMVIFKYERIPRELSLSVPETWSLGRSDNGWMTRETFYEYICNIFNKWLDDNNVPRPVLLFIDGHTSHLSFQVSKFCSENGIILIALFPNATHLLQPMDVAVFRSLKGAWKTAVHSWRLENIDSPALRKIHFCPLLNKVLKDTLTPAIFQNGFRKCGLMPWNPDEVCCIPEPLTNDLADLQAMAKIKELEIGINFLDKYIDAEKIYQFKGCNEWLGVKEDISLFQFYKKVEELLNESKKNLTSSTTLTSQDLISEQSSTTAIKTLAMNDENLNVTLDIITEDPKTPSKVPDDNISRNTQNNTNINSLTMPSTSTQHISAENSSKDMIIPSPFKRALFWPTPKENCKKRKKEKIPSVASSLQWQKYHESKEKKKTELEEEKKRKAEERKMKKKQNEEARQLKTAHKLANKNLKTVKKKINNTEYSSDTSTDTEWVESGDSMDDVSDEHENDDEENVWLEQEEDIKQSDYVIVNFPGKKKFYKYVCIVQKVTRTDIEVMAMMCCDQSKTVFKENDNDISTISKSQIVEVLHPPKMIITGDRIKYKFDAPLQVDG
ncbi:unnamed protein product [Parnassius mnemosyne]|uniref:HTH CENPB-type domain-containing protein n=1 Tax=Parnassius mnemosyne TaxID=213953 RepID=A0AAV1K9K5_9NEOP